MIEYRVRPLLNIPMTWLTEITHVVPGKLFVDEQRSGPYRSGITSITSVKSASGAWR